MKKMKRKEKKAGISKIVGDTYLGEIRDIGFVNPVFLRLENCKREKMEQSWRD